MTARVLQDEEISRSGTMGTHFSSKHCECFRRELNPLPVNNSKPRHSEVSEGTEESLLAAALRDASFVGMTARVLQDEKISRSGAAAQWVRISVLNIANASDAG